MGDVQITCLGPVRVVDHGVPVELRSARQRHLLAALVAAGDEGLSADQLVDEVWGDEALPGSRESAARMLVHRTRQKLGDAIETVGGRYRLDLSSNAVDAWHFDQLLTDGDSDSIAAAAALWNGTPFDDVDATGRVGLERQRLVERRSTACKDAGWLIEPGEHEDLLPLVLRALDEQLHNEGLAAAAIGALYRLGRQAEALELAQRCRSALREDLGLEAGHELRAVEQAVLTQDDPALAARRPGSHAPSRTETTVPPRLTIDRATFVGRTEALARLTEAQTASIAGPGRLMVIAGPAGIGKSWLAAEFAAELARSGGVVRAGFGGAGDTVVYEPILRALPELADDVERLGETRDPAVGRLRFWQATERALAALAAQGPALVVLEDMHEADSQTCMLLTYLSSAALPAHLMVLVTARPSEDLAPTPWNDTLGAIATSAGASGVVEIMQLPPLSGDELADLTRVHHPDEPVPLVRSFAEELHRRSGGNALVASTLSRDASAGLRPPIETADTAIEDVLRLHVLGRVDTPVADVLSVAAVLGIEFDVEPLARLTDEPEEEVLDRVDVARRAGIVFEVGLDRFRFDHALTAAAFADRLSGSRRSRIHAAIIDTESLDPIARARSVIGAGSLLPADEAARILLESADELLAGFAFLEAISALERVLERLDDDSEHRFDILLRLATATSRVADTTRARTYRAEAFALASKDADPERMCMVAMSGLPAGELVSGEPDRLTMFASFDPDEITAMAPATVWRNWIRQARVTEDFELASAVIDRYDAIHADDDAPPDPQIETERLLQAAYGPSAEPVRQRLADLARLVPEGPDRSELRQRELAAALVENDPDAAGACFEQVERSLRTDAAPRDVWLLEMLDAALNAVGMRASGTTSATAYRTGVRLGIPDAFSAFMAQQYVELWITDRLGDALGALDAIASDIALNVAWRAGIALAAATTGDTERTREMGDAVMRELRDRPHGVWNSVGAALLVETSQLAGEVTWAEVGADALRPRQGTSILLGMGIVHLGPVDRYLGIAASVTGSTDADALLRRGYEQATSIGSSVWADRAARALGETATDGAAGGMR